MNGFLKPSRRDLVLEENFDGFLLVPKLHNKLTEISIILVPDSIDPPTNESSGCESTNVSTSVSYDVNDVASPEQNNMHNEKNITLVTDKPKLHKPKILNQFFLDVTSKEIYKLIIQTKDCKTISDFLRKLTVLVSRVNVLNLAYKKRFTSICSIDGIPIKTVLELINFRIAICCFRPLYKTEIISVSRILHRIPFLVPKGMMRINYKTVKQKKSDKARSKPFHLPNTSIGSFQHVPDNEDNSDVDTCNSNRGSIAQQMRSEDTLYGSHIICKETEIFNSHYKDFYNVHEQIGEGNFSIVYRAEARTESRETVAIKIISEETYKHRKEFIDREIFIMKELYSDRNKMTTHMNIISFYGAYQAGVDGLGLILEYADISDLYAFVSEISVDEANQDTTCIDEPIAACIMHQMLLAIDYIHKHDIIHRDIKPENILLCENPKNKNYPLVKICDFGLAIQIDPSSDVDKNKVMRDICGTPYYIAPEMLLQTGYGKKIDIWAAGVVLHVMLAGFPPFYSETDDQNEIFESIIDCEIDFSLDGAKNISDEGKNLIYKLVTFDPYSRGTAETAVKDEWFKECLSAIDFN